MSALQALLRESIDYAGLFPPAALGMREAVENYAAYRAGPDAWALGRFVVPAARLGELETAAAELLPRAAGLAPWRIAALLGSEPKEAFFVRCDRSTMTQNDLDNGRLICLIGVAVVKPAEFVIFRIGQKTADARS